MRQRQAELAGIRVLVVSFAPARTAARYLEPWTHVFDVWVDPQRKAYRSWGLRRRGLSSWLTAGTIRIYLDGFRHGRRWRPRQLDFRQLGGDAVIDAAGIVRLWHPSQSPDDRPSIDALIAAARSAG